VSTNATDVTTNSSIVLFGEDPRKMKAFFTTGERIPPIKPNKNLITINVIKIGKTIRRPATNFLLVFFLKSPV
jgi:hypothetical protein